MGGPIGFAHRGARAHAPENTIEAFALALEMGATGLETDAWLTADGVAVLDHGGVVGGRAIAALSHEELPSHVPTLAALYDTCGSDFELSIDVKDEVVAPELIEVGRAYDALPRLWLCHWNWRTVVRWRELSSHVRLVDSTRATHMRTPPPERARRMAELGIDAINLHHSDWDPDWVPVFRSAGRLTFAWDAQQEETVRRLVRMGVDAVYSDHVDRMMRGIAEP